MDVLTSAVLVGQILEYQSGLYEDFVPFCKLSAPCSQSWPHGDMLCLARVIGPWLSVWRTSPSNRIGLLVCALPHTRELLLMHASYFGDVASMQVIFASTTTDLSDTRQLHLVGRGAVANNQIGVLELLLQLSRARPLVSPRGMDVAISRGHVDVVAWLGHHDPSSLVTVTRDAIDTAVEHGYVDVLDCVHSINSTIWPGYSSCSVRHAALNGHLAVLVWLQEACHDTTIASTLVKTNQLDLLVQLVSQLSQRQLPVLLTSDDLSFAIAQDMPDMTTFLLETMDGTHRTCHASAIDSVIGRGDVPMLSFLQTSLATWPNYSPRGVVAAAKSGYIDALMWLHANDPCPGTWTAKPMDVAAREGHLNVVQFLHTHRTEGCSKWAMDNALEHGHVAVATFLQGHRTEGPSYYAMRSAASTGNTQVLEFLNAHYPHHFGWSVDVLDDAVNGGHLDTVKWLTKHRREGGTKWGLAQAFAKGHVEIGQILSAMNSHE